MKSFASVTVVEIMTREVISISKNASIMDVASQMIKHHVSALPILDGDKKLKGLITTFDLLLILAIRTFNRTMTIETLYQTAGKIATVKETDTLAAAVTIFNEQRTKTLPVLNDQGQMTGIVSVSSIMNYLYQHLEKPAARQGRVPTP